MDELTKKEKYLLQMLFEMAKTIINYSDGYFHMDGCDEIYTNNDLYKLSEKLGGDIYNY